MIEIVEGRYFTCWWVFRGDGFDWLTTLWRDAEGPWVLQCRLRIVVDDKIGEASGDEKIWWRATLPREMSEAEAEAQALVVVTLERDIRSLKQIARGQGACSEIRATPIHSSNMEVVVKIVAGDPWSHVMETAPGGQA
jgi:hypothetical protein